VVGKNKTTDTGSYSASYTANFTFVVTKRQSEFWSIFYIKRNEMLLAISIQQLNRQEAASVEGIYRDSRVPLGNSTVTIFSVFTCCVYVFAWLLRVVATVSKVGYTFDRSFFVCSLNGKRHDKVATPDVNFQGWNSLRDKIFN
jgi:hypothetical protein